MEGCQELLHTAKLVMVAMGFWDTNWFRHFVQEELQAHMSYGKTFTWCLYRQEITKTVMVAEGHWATN